MKVAKNGKSAFINLLEVIDSFKPEDREHVKKFLAKKRQETEQLELFDEICIMLDEGQSSGLVDENEFKKPYEDKTNTKNKYNLFNKRVKNLYERILIFISKEYQKSEWKKWQIEATERLLQIEALFKKKLYSQAVSVLLNLEEKVKNNNDYHKWVYDDLSIYTRLANLKVSLHQYARDLYEVNEVDRMFHDLLQTGYYFYDSKRERINQNIFSTNKMLGYWIIAKYFADKKEYDKAIESLSNAIYAIGGIEQYEAPEKKAILNFLLLYKQQLALENGDFRVVREIRDEFYKTTQDSITTIMLFEQMNFDTQLLLGLKNNEHEKLEKNDNYSHGLYLYSEEKIELFALRKEFNTAILKFINTDFSACLKIIKDIKSIKKVKDKDSLFYLNILLLELLAEKLNGKADFEYLRRSIRGILKEKPYLKFENKANKLFFEWMNMTEYGLKDFSKENKEKMNELNSLAKNTEPMHYIIIAALGNKL